MFILQQSFARPTPRWVCVTDRPASARGEGVRVRECEGSVLLSTLVNSIARFGCWFSVWSVGLLARCSFVSPHLPFFHPSAASASLLSLLGRSSSFFALTLFCFSFFFFSPFLFSSSLLPRSSLSRSSIQRTWSLTIFLPRISPPCHPPPLSRPLPPPALALVRVLVLSPTLVPMDSLLMLWPHLCPRPMLRIRPSSPPGTSSMPRSSTTATLLVLKKRAPSPASSPIWSSMPHPSLQS